MAYLFFALDAGGSNTPKYAIYRDSGLGTIKKISYIIHSTGTTEEIDSAVNSATAVPWQGEELP